MTVSPVDSEIYGGLFGTVEMRTLFADRHRLHCMLVVEAALARAQARLGIIPREAADAITAAAVVDNLSLPELAESTRLAGVPVMGVAKALGNAAGKEAARYVHWGATTQDILDTALVLQMRDGLRLIEEALAAMARGLARQAEAHRHAVMTGRTYLQQALPVTLGYKCAIWLDPLIRHAERLEELKPRLLRVQFGGAVGTLASLGTQGRAVTEALAEELGLAAPEAPWHVSRDGVAEAACTLGLLCGSLAKFATDVILLMQTEIGEVSEPYEAGRGGSSTMPQKRNPVASTYVVAASRSAQALVPLMLSAMAQDQERATGPWQSEFMALPQIFVLTAGALAHAGEVAQGLTADTEAMRRNLDMSHGLLLSEAVMMALAEKIGRADAHHALQHAAAQAIAERRPLADILAEDEKVAAHLDHAALARLTEPANYLGEAEAVVDRVVARAKEVFGP